MSSRVEPAKRQKALHNKTRSGCAQCRRRRVKCDEAKPACQRCTKANLTCPGYEEEPAPRKARKPLNRFRIVPFHAKGSAATAEGSPSAATAPDTSDPLDLGTPSETKSLYHDGASHFATPSDDSDAAPRLSQSPMSYEQAAIDYFIAHTIPVLSKHSPSFFLWHSDGIAHLLEERKTRNMVIAIGLAHQAQSSVLLCQASYMLPSSHSSTSAPWDWYYSESLTSLQSELASPGSKTAPSTAVLTCLFFVILASILGRREEVLVHLECGLSIIREHGVHFVLTSRLNQELFLLLLNLGMSSWSYRPNKILLELLSALTQWDVRLDFLSKVEQFRARLDMVIVAIYRFAATVTHGNDVGAANQTKGVLLRDIEDFCLALDAYEEELARQDEQEVDAWSQCSSRTAHASVKMMRARAIFANVFVSSVMTRYQTTYDRHQRKFREMFELMRTCLLDMYGEGVEADFAVFSIQTNIVSTLWQVIFLCRHAELRRAAMGLLPLCPRREGLWDALEQHKVAFKIIEFEERDVVWGDAFGMGMLVPEENRVHLVNWKPAAEVNGRDGVYRILHRPDGDAGYLERLIEVDHDPVFGPLP